MQLLKELIINLSYILLLFRKRKYLKELRKKQSYTHTLELSVSDRFRKIKLI